MMLARRTPARAPAVLAVAALTALAGCGGGDPAPKASQTVGPVDRAGLTTAVTTTLRTRPNHVRFAATFRKGGGRAHTQTVDAHRGTAGGERADFVTDGSRAEVRRQGGTGWLRSAQPAFTRALPAGKPWLRLSASQLTAAGLPTVDELLNLLHVSDATDEVTDHGSATVDDVTTRVSSFTIDLKKAVCAAPEDTRLEIATLMNSDPRESRTMNARVWTDAFHLVRRMTVRAQAAGITADYDLKVMGDNTAVRVQAPPKGQTVEIGDVPKLDRALSTPRPAAPECRP